MLANRHTKILATMGPSLGRDNNLERAIRAGLNAVRLNFSHGTYNDHLASLTKARRLAADLRAPLTLVQDLQGPKIRVADLPNSEMTIQSGQEVILTPDKSNVGTGIIPVDFYGLPEAARPGAKILLDDGLMELQVLEVKGDQVRAKVIFGGLLKSRKGVNLPGVYLPIDAMTKKDIEDLKFGLKHNVDYIALSFVRRASDIENLREAIHKAGSKSRIIAKIEMLEALDNLEEIIELSDAVMVARGDLAIETGAAALPGVQKQIIHLCNKMDRPVITATQMLDSMVNNPRPTRAEITDVANAVLDGSDCLMLSAETASGKFPVECISTMHEIISEVEKTNVLYYLLNFENDFSDIPEAIGACASLAALKLNASAIVCLTTTGRTASLISQFRPKCRVIAVTQNVETLNRLEIIWGLQTVQIDPYENSDDAMEKVIRKLQQFRLIHPGDRIILTLGVPVTQKGKTNALRAYQVKDADIEPLPLDEIPLRFRPKDM